MKTEVKVRKNDNTRQSYDKLIKNEKNLERLGMQDEEWERVCEKVRENEKAT